MKLTHQDDTLRVQDLEELTAANAGAFRSGLKLALSPAVRQIDIDLSRTGFVDCGGLGALIALRNRLRRHNPGAVVRLLNPNRSVQRIIHLTRLDQLFPIDIAQDESQPKTPVPSVATSTPAQNQVPVLP